MALSMEEQRMLDEMERQLAVDDPKLASRFSSFGQARRAGVFTSARAKTITGLLALALIAAVTIMMFVISPYGSGHRGSPPRSTPSSATRGSGSSAHPSGS